ncbi:MAG: hypothetical protein R3D00_13755 [Bacteroidia bacterium]
MTRILSILFISIQLTGFSSCQKKPEQTAQTATVQTVKVPDTLMILTLERTIYPLEKTVSMPWAVRLSDVLADIGKPISIVRSFYEFIPENLADSLISLHPAVVVIDFGLMESWVNTTNQNDDSALPLTEFRNRLHQLSKTFSARGIYVILLTPNPLGEAYEKWRSDRLEMYAATIRDLANQFSLALVDVEGSFGQYASIPGNQLSDLLIEGKYPNDIGQAIIAEDVGVSIAYQLYPGK